MFFRAQNQNILGAIMQFRLVGNLLAVRRLPTCITAKGGRTSVTNEQPVTVLTPTLRMCADSDTKQ
jgi:hypothetical protein